MPTRLVLVAGPSQGAQVALETDEVAVGRDPSCGVCLPDATLSRRHAEFARTPEGWRVRDLGSLNGLRVNGRSVAEQALSDGDRIEIGATLLVFHLDAPPGPPDGSAPGDEPAVLSTVRLSASSALFVSGVGAVRERDRPLAVLLAAGRRLAAARSEEELGETLLDAALVASGAAGGTVLVTGSDGPREIASRQPPGTGAVRVPGGSVSEALARREALVVRLDGREAAVVPVVRGEEALGALTVVAGTAPFSEDVLQLLFGLAASAAVSLALVRHLSWLEGERRRLEASRGDEGLRGGSAAISRVRDLLARAAGSDASVLLTGESGTGKELAARALHARSARRDGPFVAVNSAALVDTLVESELFGHERGAFTGAVARRRGRLEAAHRGTLFLDEVGEMSASTQAKLLRVLETRSFERVGGAESVKVDVRVVAATNRDLAAEVRAHRFREDLFYRLAVVTIALPPLRERREDVPGLASHFLAHQAERLGRRVEGFAPEALGRLVAYDWPGNVRELSNAVERAAVLCAGPLVRPEDLPEALLESAAAGGGEGLAPYHEAVNRAKRQAVAAALAQSGGSVTEAARALGLHPNYLHRLLNQLGLRGEGGAA